MNLRSAAPLLAAATVAVFLGTVTVATAAPRPEPVPYTPNPTYGVETAVVEPSQFNWIRSLTATCPPGKIASGGGFSWPQSTPLQVTASRPEGNGWRVDVQPLSNGYGAAVTVTAYAICINAA